MARIPQLSVIMPVYNGSKYVADAMESVLSQARGETSIEIIVSDDGSTDDSRKILETQARAGRIRLIDGPRIGNWVSNSNAAVGRASGELITFLHQDDLWLPGRLDAIRETVRSLPESEFWISPTHFIDSTGRFVGTWHLPLRFMGRVVDPDELLGRLLVQNFLGMPAPVFRRSAFDAVGGMDETCWFTADWDLWLKLGARVPVGVDTRPTTAFRLHAQSQTIRGLAAVESMRRQTEVVRSRNLHLLRADRSRDTAARAGAFSSELNAAVASIVCRQSVRWRELARAMSHLGLRGAVSFAGNARFLERSIARFRIGLATGHRTG